MSEEGQRGKVWASAAELGERSGPEAACLAPSPLRACPWGKQCLKSCLSHLLVGSALYSNSSRKVILRSTGDTLHGAGGLGTVDLLSQGRGIHEVVQANPLPAGHKLRKEAIGWCVGQELRGMAERATRIRDEGWGVGRSSEA